MKGLMLAASSVLILAACAGGDEPSRPTTVSDVTVSTDLQSVGNAQAVSYWQTLDEDLQTALAAEFVGNIDPGGAIVTVDVDEISLATAYGSRFQGEDARLTGTVVLTAPGSGENLGTYNVVASAGEVASLYSGTADVTTISPDSSEFYAALVQVFARGVADRVRAGT